MKIGIMGLGKSGKTTVFNAMTGQNVDSTGHHKDKFNLGIVKVPDKRIDCLSSIFEPVKTTFAEILFLDYINTENMSKGLSNEYIIKLRECDGILKVIRAFENEIYAPALGELNPLKELIELDDEIILNDILIVEKRLEKLTGAKYKLSNDEKNEIASMEKFKAMLDEGRPLHTAEHEDKEMKIARNFGMLSMKRDIILINAPASDYKPHEALLKKLAGREFVIVCAEDEKELNLLDAESRKELAGEMGITEFGIEKVIIKLYDSLNLITFMTVGKDEVKGWTISNGTNALNAAGKIHSDIQRGFIKAQVMSFDHFKEHGSAKECSAHGVLRLEGKEYIVKDGDIIEFKFNV